MGNPGGEEERGGEESCRRRDGRDLDLGFERARVVVGLDGTGDG